MKKKIKLRYLTPEQWDANNDSICKSLSPGCCENCIFRWVGCEDSILRSSWINHKDLYSDKFLDQEIEIETLDILDEKEKKYLREVIKPFRNRVVCIRKVGCANNDKYFIGIKISSRLTLSEVEFFYLPLFQNDMYMGMESNKEYSLEELGL